MAHYDGIRPHYGLWWGFDSDFIRHYAMDDFNKFLYYNDQVNHGFLQGYDKLGGHDNFLDVVLPLIAVQPSEERVAYAVVADGTAEDIGERLASVSKRPDDLEAAYRTC